MTLQAISNLTVRSNSQHEYWHCKTT